MCKMVDETKNQKGVSYSVERLPNKEAIIHFQGKTLLTSESYFDVKAYEHALAFTVAKIADEDLLKTVRDAIQSALENGTDFRTFKRTLLPYLNAQGWGNFTEDKQLLDRRLRTIFNTNMSSSYSAGQWQRIQKTKEFLPYLKYMPSLSANKRDEHKQYYGIVRPVDDPIWQSIFPKNGYGCRCWVKQLTQRQAEKEGISDPVDLEMETVENPRTGEKMITPKGVHFSFNHNHDRLSALLKLAEEKHGIEFSKNLRKQIEPILRKIKTSQRNDLPLTDKQKDDVLKIVSKYGIDLQSVRFVENNNTAFVLMYGVELLQIGFDVYPTNNPHIYNNANSILSMPATIAHELAGHRDAQLAEKTHHDDLLEEVQASIRASMYGIDLTEEEKEMLYQDALDRLAKNGLKLEDIKHTLWLESFGKTK